MPGGGILTLEACNEELKEDPCLQPGSGSRVKITIRDNGIGIPVKHLHKVFDPYFSTKEKGSGLGLAVAISVIEKHGGKITVASDLGKGTEFQLFLPASAQRVISTKPRGNHPCRKTGTILVMDDEITVRESVSTMLGAIGFRVETTENGEEAIAAYSQAFVNNKHYDIVILDLTVPGAMGGEEAIRLNQTNTSFNCCPSQRLR